MIPIKSNLYSKNKYNHKRLLKNKLVGGGDGDIAWWNSLTLATQNSHIQELVDNREEIGTPYMVIYKRELEKYRRALEDYNKNKTHKIHPDNTLLQINDNIKIEFSTYLLILKKIIDNIKIVKVNTPDEFKKWNIPASNNWPPDEFEKWNIPASNNWPLNMTELVFTKNFFAMHITPHPSTLHYPIDLTGLPQSVKCISFGNSFLFPINNQYVSLPNKLEELNCGAGSKTEVGVFPEGLLRLTLGSRFNSVISKNILPSTLKELTFGHSFNQTIAEDVLPALLEKLTFKYEYNNVIAKNVLPKALKTLTFGYDYNVVIEKNVLPDTLEELTFYYNYDIPLTFPWPPILSKLNIVGYTSDTQTRPVAPITCTVYKNGKEWS